MEASPETGSGISGPGKRIVQRLFMIMENRIQLAMVELEEERERVLLAVSLAIGAAVSALLAIVLLNVAIILVLWNYCPLLVIGLFTVFYATAATLLFMKLSRMRRNWQMFSGTLDQLKKDRECLEKKLL
jgi:uncharacterized membrane protein YqjE